jgi:PAS domain S-box-containing protein
LRILIVEDDLADAEMYVRNLKRSGFEVIPDIVQSPGEFVEKLSNERYAVILCDYRLGGWTGMDALLTLRQLDKDIPFILISGTVGEDLAVEFIKKGAADYVLKDRMARLPLVIRRALEEKSLREARRRFEEELRASEERYRDLVENANDIVYTLDLQGNLTSFNKAGERITGYNRDEILEHSLGEVMQPDQLALMQEMLKRKLAGEGVTTYEIEISAKDGRTLVLEVSSRLIYKDGKPVGVQGIARDVTERKRAEEELRRGEARIRAVVETALDCIISIDHTGKITEFNPAAEKTFGYTRDSVLGKELAETIIPPALRERHRKGLERYLDTAEGPVLFKRIELTAMRADGTEFPVELSISPIPQQGQPLFTAYLRDITERKQSEREREVLISELQDALAKVKTLSGLLPICAWCKKIRDDRGYWSQIEVYIEQHSDAAFTHGVCPDCARSMYPELR